MNNENCLFEKKNRVAVITLNRPKALNVLNRATLEELQTLLNQIHQDKSIRCVVITGSGKAFAAGADIKEMVEMNATQAKEFAQLGQQVFSFIEMLPQPVIACLNGFALGGGCELACACDLRSGAKTLKIGEPEVNLGIIPGFGGSFRLPRLVGLSRAKQMILTGEALNAEEALQAGLLHWVFNAEELLPKTLLIAERMAQKPLSALASAKKLLRETLDYPIAESEKREAEAFSRCFNSPDQREGMQAFLEKRSPRFEGN